MSVNHSLHDLSPEPYALGAESSVLIAAFWDNIDYEEGGRVYYRFTSRPSVLDRIATNISAAFGVDFDPTWAFIATWDILPQSTNVMVVRINLT